MEQQHTHRNTIVAPIIDSICRIAIKELYKAGKIPCIKFVREITYLGLKEAKDYVEKVMADNSLDFPEVDWATVDNLRQELSTIKTRIRYLTEDYKIE